MSVEELFVTAFRIWATVAAFLVFICFGFYGEMEKRYGEAGSWAAIAACFVWPAGLFVMLVFFLNGGKPKDIF